LPTLHALGPVVGLGLQLQQLRRPEPRAQAL
jgi:hypothetical protein